MVSTEAVLPIWLVVVLGLAAPVVTAAGYFLNSRKVQEIHVLVNSTLTKKTEALDRANTRLVELGELPEED